MMVTGNTIVYFGIFIFGINAISLAFCKNKRMTILIINIILTIGLLLAFKFDNSSREVFVYDKKIITCDVPDCYDYRIYFIYENECYSTKINGKEFSMINCEQNIYKYDLDNYYWTNSEKIKEKKN